MSKTAAAREDDDEPDFDPDELSLDQIEAERPEGPKPFVFRLDDDNVFEFVHPNTLPFRDLIGLDLNRPGPTLMTILGRDAFDALMNDDRVDGYVADKIFEGWTRHFGLDLTPGENRASRRSSGASARRSRQTSSRGR